MVDGFDRDYFTFRIESVVEVKIEASSNPELRTFLLDSSGRILAASGGEARQVEATLAAGRYYVRVEGESDGDYRLDLSYGEER